MSCGWPAMRPTWRTTLIAVLASVLLASSLFAQTLTVRVSRGNVRAQPSKSSPIIGKINKGEVYDTEGRQGDWFKILLETGREGWVFKSLVEVSGKRTIGVVPLGPPHRPPGLTATPGPSLSVSTGIENRPCASTTPSTTPGASQPPFKRSASPSGTSSRFSTRGPRPGPSGRRSTR